MLLGEIKVTKSAECYCLFCKKPFLKEVGHQIYCTLKCGWTHRAGKARAAKAICDAGKPKRDRSAEAKKRNSIRVKKLCVMCGKPFMAHEFSIYCSADCKKHKQRVVYREKKVKMTKAEKAESAKIFSRICDKCGIPFKGKWNQRFCSTQCYKADRKVHKKEIPCARCSAVFLERNNGVKKRYCSGLCRGRDKEDKLKRGVVTIVCINCRTPFETSGKNKKRMKLCSDYCAAVSVARRCYYRRHPTAYLDYFQSRLNIKLGEHLSEQPTNQSE